MSSQVSAFSKRIWWAVRPLWYWRLLRLFLRSFWVSIALGVAGWQLSLAQGWPLNLVVWGAISYALFMVLFPSSLLWPIPVPLIARRLDKAFGLRDRLSTADEVAQRAPGNYLEQRLLGSADRLLRTIRGRLARQNHMPWTDLALAIVAMALLFAIYLNASALDAPPFLSAAPPQPPSLPALAPEQPVELPGTAPSEELADPNAPDEGEAPSDTQTVEGDALDPAAAQAATDALTEALGEQAITKSAAADLAQGNAQGAAERLRGLADQAEAIDPAASEALAESLREAAEEMQGTAPGVADQIAEAAEAIAPDPSLSPAENAAAAAEGLEDLADLVEALDQSRIAGSNDASGTGGTGAGQNEGESVDRESQTTGTTERLQTDGQPVELSADEVPEDENQVLQPPQHSGEATDTTTAPYTQSGGTGSGGEVSSDPLSFPWRLRRVIQRFFSP